jgi:hypothetical protein
MKTNVKVTNEELVAYTKAAGITLNYDGAWGTTDAYRNLIAIVKESVLQPSGDVVSVPRGDTLLLDALESAAGCNLISDDNGKWAISAAGFQPMPPIEGFEEIVSIVSDIEPSQWKGSVREAIQHFISDECELQSALSQPSTVSDGKEG